MGPRGPSFYAHFQDAEVMCRIAYGGWLVIANRDFAVRRGSARSQCPSRRSGQMFSPETAQTLFSSVVVGVSPMFVCLA
jgi:hypothetical protein